MRKSAAPGANQRLRAERLRHRWSQQELAERVGVSVITINRWERGATVPSPYYRLKLCSLFGKSATELGLFPDENAPEPDESEYPQLPRQLRYLPYRRNPFFTGRDSLLAYLHTRLHTLPAQVYALCGLGGIGKTQTAIEYAYRFHSDYQAIIWLQGETQETLVRGCQGLTRHLGLILREEHTNDYVIDMIRGWLEEHEHWLLILDNVEKASTVEVILPSMLTGHVLLTTRAQATGPLAQHINLKQLSDDEGTLLLLRRAKYLPTSARLRDISTAIADEARAISRSLGGLPLALDQAGAYIEETGCGLSDYRTRYQERRKDLLNRRGGNHMEHPASIASTIALCVERLEQREHAAAELLRCCAFLHHESITEDLLRLLSPDLGEPLSQTLNDSLSLDDAIARLRALSLLYRHTASRKLVVHTLVQDVLRDSLSDEQRRLWSERIVWGLNRIFVEEPNLDTLRQNEQLLPQVILSLERLEELHMVLPEASQLLYKAARYLALRGQYAQAEGFLRKAFALLAQLPPIPERECERAMLLDCAGMVYEAQGAYQQAEQAYQESLKLLERTQPSNHPVRGEILASLGRLALQQGHMTQARNLLDRALALQQRLLGSNHPGLVPLFNIIADLHYQRGEYQQAEAMLHRSLAICRQQLGETHPHTIEGLSSLATIYQIQGRYEQAEEMYQQAISTIRASQEETQYYTVPALRGLGLLYGLQGQYSQAEALLKQALAICQQTSGHTHPETAESLRSLGIIYRLQANYPQAEALLRRACDVFSGALGAEHPEVAESLNTLGIIYGLQGKYVQAQEALIRSNAILRKIFGDMHPRFAENQAALGMVYGLQGQYQRAEALLLQARDIQERELGADHPTLASTLYSLATFYHEQGRDEQARPLATRALAIREQVWPLNHPEVAESRDLLNVLS